VLPPAPDTWRRPRPGQDQAPPGWPAASLDPGCGRRPGAAEREHASTDPARDGADGQQREGLDRRFGCEPRPSIPIGIEKRDARPQSRRRAPAERRPAVTNPRISASTARRTDTLTPSFR